MLVPTVSGSAQEPRQPLLLRGKRGYHLRHNDRSLHHGTSREAPRLWRSWKIQHAVRTMCYSLERCSQMHSRFFKFVDRFPVRCRRTGFHKKKWFLPDTAHQVMLHRRINGCDIFFFFCAIPDSYPRRQYREHL